MRRIPFFVFAIVFATGLAAQDRGYHPHSGYGMMHGEPGHGFGGHGMMYDDDREFGGPGTMRDRFGRDVGGCNIDEDAFLEAFDRCRGGGGAVGDCRRSARREACVPPVATPPQGGGGPRFDRPAFPGGMEIFDPDFAGRTQGCEPPRPDNIGCTTLCKPCITFVCNDGAWEAQRIDFPDEVCNPRPGSGPDMTACPRDDTGFCPAECSICF